MTTRNIARPAAVPLAMGLNPCPLWAVDFTRGDTLPDVSLARTTTSRGLLIEAATVNQATYSNDLSQWNLNGNAVLHHATAAPDGSTAYSMAMDAVWYSGVYRSLAGLTNGAPLTFSGYFKYVSGDPTILFGSDQAIFSGGNPALLTFNCQTGAVVTTSTGLTAYSVVAVGGGWFRAQLTATLATGTTSSILIFHGAGVVGENAAWGLQAEQGRMATSLVTTGVNPLSRPADVVTIGSLPLVGFNPAEGTLLVEAEFEGIDGNTTQPLFEIDDGSASNRLVLGQASGHLTATVTAAGSSILSANVLGSPVAGSIYKMALGYKNAAFSACANGGTVSTAASGAVPGGLSSFRLGSNHDGSAFANGWVRKVSYYPCKLADGELKNLTV